LELNNSASFVGEIHPVEIRNLLGDVDILVLPSRAEGLPVSVLEGFSAGLAVIATKVGSLEEFAEHRTSIYFLNNCSSFDVANAFCDLLSEDLRNELSRGARALWQAKFDVRRTTSELEETWQRASQKARSK
jgi:glycosyltransferase involved in cell wall biosynthesis